MGARPFRCYANYRSTPRFSWVERGQQKMMWRTIADSVSKRTDELVAQLVLTDDGPKEHPLREERVTTLGGTE